MKITMCANRGVKGAEDVASKLSSGAIRLVLLKIDKLRRGRSLLLLGDRVQSLDPGNGDRTPDRCWIEARKRLAP
jgi:hypothetical protein